MRLVRPPKEHEPVSTQGGKRKLVPGGAPCHARLEAGVVKLVDTLDLGSSAARRAGSIPVPGIFPRKVRPVRKQSSHDDPRKKGDSLDSRHALARSLSWIVVSLLFRARITEETSRSALRNPESTSSEYERETSLAVPTTFRRRVKRSS